MEDKFGPRPHQDPILYEAERSVLAALILDDRNYNLIRDILYIEDFSNDDRHQCVFDAVEEIVKRGGHVDILTLQDYLDEKGLLKSIGGVEYLKGFYEDIPSVGMLIDHALIIKRRSRRIYSKAE